MKRLLSVFLSIVMLFCALSVFVKAEENQCPWRDYDNYLFYNKSYLEYKIGYVTNFILVKFNPSYFDYRGPANVSDFGDFIQLIDSFYYDDESDVYVVFLKEDNFEIDENGCPIYTKEWLDKVIAGFESLYSEPYIIDLTPNIAEYLEPFKLSRTLSYGCKGDDVKAAQKYLRAYGYLEATPDGIFGAMTETAVKMFQAYNGLSNPDGKIGNWTARKFNSDETYYFSPLTTGMRGNDVKVMQTYLKKLGYLSATPDGIFGAKSKKALIEFQKDHGLYITGSADFQTLSAIFNRNTKNKSYYQLSLSRTLKYGDRGNDVKKVQIMLYELGYLLAIPDGIYGVKTESAVITFQAFNGLSNPDGKVGGWTLSKLNGEPCTFTNLKNGSRGNAVLVLQKYLAKLNYMKNLRFSNFSSVYTDITPDGVFGSYTDSAVKIFQFNNDLRWDGVVTLDTYLAVVSRNAKAKVLDGKAFIIPDLIWYDAAHNSLYN